MEDLFIYIRGTQQQQQQNIHCILIGPYVVVDVDGNFVIRARRY